MRKEIWKMTPRYPLTAIDVATGTTASETFEATKLTLKAIALALGSLWDTMRAFEIGIEAA